MTVRGLQGAYKILTGIRAPKAEFHLILSRFLEVSPDLPALLGLLFGNLLIHISDIPFGTTDRAVIEKTEHKGETGWLDILTTLVVKRRLRENVAEVTQGEDHET